GYRRRPRIHPRAGRVPELHPELSELSDRPRLLDHALARGGVDRLLRVQAPRSDGIQRVARLEPDWPDRLRHRPAGLPPLHLGDLRQRALRRSVRRCGFRLFHRLPGRGRGIHRPQSRRGAAAQSKHGGIGMAEQQRSVETKASPEAVWRIWSDTSTWPQWNLDVQAMALNGPFAAGTTGTMKTKQGTRQIQLTDVVPGKSFRLETTVIPLTRFAFECQVAAGPAGNTTIRQGIRVGGPLG